MFAPDFFEEARQDHSKALDLALELTTNRSQFGEADILSARKVFLKWYYYFAAKFKEPSNKKKKKKNYSYLKNKFKRYYDSTFD